LNLNSGVFINRCFFNPSQNYEEYTNGGGKKNHLFAFFKEAIIFKGEELLQEIVHERHEMNRPSFQYHFFF